MNTTNTPVSRALNVANELSMAAIRLMNNPDRADFRETVQRCCEQWDRALKAVSAAHTFDVGRFTPQNGRCAIQRVDATHNVWKVLAIADNWPHAHHPLAVGEHLVPHGYTYPAAGIPGVVAWITPKEILAIERPAAPVPHQPSIR